MIFGLFGCKPTPKGRLDVREFAPPTHVGTYSPGADFRTGYADRMGGHRSRRQSFAFRGLNIACDCPRCAEYQDGYDQASKDITRKEKAKK